MRANNNASRERRRVIGRRRLVALGQLNVRVRISHWLASVLVLIGLIGRRLRATCKFTVTLVCAGGANIRARALHNNNNNINKLLLAACCSSGDIVTNKKDKCAACERQRQSIKSAA